MTSVTDLYSINYNLAMCEVWLASCFILVALGFTEILMAMIFLICQMLRQFFRILPIIWYILQLQLLR